MLSGGRLPNGLLLHRSRQGLTKSEALSTDPTLTDEGTIVSTQALDNVDGILTAQGGVEGVRSDGSAKKHARK